jgi:hypothetical protein
MEHLKAITSLPVTNLKARSSSIKYKSNSLPRRPSTQNLITKQPLAKTLDYLDSPNQQIYISKAITLISKIPLVYSPEILLQNIWRLFNDGKSAEEIETLIFHILTVDELDMV